MLPGAVLSSVIATASASSGDSPVGTSTTKAATTRARDLAGLITLGIRATAAMSPRAAPFGSEWKLATTGTLYGFGDTWIASGLDAGLGLSLAPAGFSYGAGFRLGPGHWLTDRFAVGLHTGIGLDGVTGSVPFALTAPVGGSMQVNLLDGLSISGRGETWWELLSARAGAATSQPDGIRAILDVCVARRTAATDDEREMNLAVGVTWLRTQGMDYVGFQIGSGVSTNPW